MKNWLHERRETVAAYQDYLAHWGDWQNPWQLDSPPAGEGPAKKSPAAARRKLACAEGESSPGATFRIGNTNSRLRFASKPAEFFERWCAEGPTHHVALGVGHRAADLRRVATLLDLEYAEVQ